MKYSCILFDMDGVIFNSEPNHEQAFRLSLATFGVQLDHTSYVTHFAGRTDRSGFEHYLATIQSTVKTTIDELLALKSEAYLKLAKTNLVTYPGIVELIQSLAPHANLGLVTGSSRIEATYSLEAIGIASLFKVIVTADDVIHGKPSPDGYMLATKRLDAATHHTVAVEDSPAGVLAAKQAGLTCIGVTTTHSSNALQAADTVVDQLGAELFN